MDDRDTASNGITEERVDFLEQGDLDTANISFSAKAQKDKFLTGSSKEMKIEPSLTEVLSKVRSYEEPRLKRDYESRPQVWPVESTFKNSERKTQVQFLGTIHDRDPQSDQIAQILQDLDEFKTFNTPQSGIVIVEGGGGKVKDSLYGNIKMEEVIQRAGEIGAVTKSAQDSGFEVISPDPTVEEIAQVLKESGIPAEQIALFYFSKDIHSIFQQHQGGILRGENRPLTQQERKQVTQLSAEEIYRAIDHVSTEAGWELEKKQLFEEEWKQAAGDPAKQETLKKPFVDSALVTLNAEMVGVGGKELLNESYQSQYAPDELYSYYTPYENKNIFNKLSKLSGDYRDKVFTKAVYDAKKSGKNVFILAGDDHEFKCRPALQQLFGVKNSSTEYAGKSYEELEESLPNAA